MTAVAGQFPAETDARGAFVRQQYRGAVSMSVVDPVRDERGWAFRSSVVS